MKVKSTRRKKPRVRKHSFDSSRVEYGWYYPDREVIRLRFPDEVVWEYENCDLTTWEELVSAASAGRFLREELDSHVHHPYE